MKILQNLIESIHKAEEKVEEAESARDRFMEPILEILQSKGGHISRCCIENEVVHITRSGSCRGSGWDDYYKFPLKIFTCDNPLSAAAEYVSNQKKFKEDADRKSKLETIKRLQKELSSANMSS